MSTSEQAMAEVAKRMQGLKDSRGQVGMMARGKNMYPAGNNAQSGPGGPDMGRPPEGPQQAMVPPAAAQAVMQKTQMNQPQVQQQPQMNPNLQAIQNRMMPQPAQPQQPHVAQQSKSMGDLAKAALQAAAKRKLQRGR